jgi:hypothetical protein
MQQERNPRLVRVDDFVAETLEAEADKMPPWTKFQADIWRDVAKDLRASENTKMVRVWEGTELKSNVASMR